jgi:ABC-type thiamine transport system substrate-binding protein
VRAGTPLPKVFADHAHLVARPIIVAPDEISARRSGWIDAWTNLVTG